MYGSFPSGDWPDLKIARHLFITFLNDNNDNERCMAADKGYRDSRYFITSNEENAAHHKHIMSPHETINKRIKQFKIMSETFRHDLNKHILCFHAVFNLTQLTIKYEGPLFANISSKLRKHQC